MPPAAAPYTVKHLLCREGCSTTCHPDLGNPAGDGSMHLPLFGRLLRGRNRANHTLCQATHPSCTWPFKGYYHIRWPQMSLGPTRQSGKTHPVHTLAPCRVLSTFLPLSTSGPNPGRGQRQPGSLPHLLRPPSPSDLPTEHTWPTCPTTAQTPVPFGKLSVARHPVPPVLTASPQRSYVLCPSTSNSPGEHHSCCLA